MRLTGPGRLDREDALQLVPTHLVSRDASCRCRPSSTAPTQENRAKRPAVSRSPSRRVSMHPSCTRSQAVEARRTYDEALPTTYDEALPTRTSREATNTR